MLIKTQWWRTTSLIVRNSNLLQMLILLKLILFISDKEVKSCEQMAGVFCHIFVKFLFTYSLQSVDMYK